LRFQVLRASFLEYFARKHYIQFMKPSNKGWIKDYLAYLNGPQNAHEFNMHLFDEFSELPDDKKLYKLVQPSGLMYGYPVRPYGNYPLRINNWDEADRTKLILLDCLINESILFSSDCIDTQKQFNDYVHHTIESIFNFYQEHVLRHDQVKLRHKKHRSESELVESILDQRVLVKSKITKNFWAGFFQNSLLFLDVFYFRQWLQSSGDRKDEALYENQENLRLSILQTIASAAWANDVIEQEEKALFKFFLQSANLNSEKEHIAEDMLKSASRGEHIQHVEHKPWIIKKYMLELAILTVWADRKVEQSEKEYIKKLSNEMQFSPEELDTSMLAVESFVISHWNQIHFLQSKHDMLIIKDRFSQRLMRIATKNKDAFVQEIHESKELMQLMVKMTRERLSNKEKEIVRAQLVDLLKTLPTFVIIALPGTFFTLPLLLKLLPKKAFPSAFSAID